MKKMKSFTALELVLLSILLAGCQHQGKNGSVDGNGMADSAAIVDWSKGFQIGPQQKGESLYVTEYLDLEHDEPGDFISNGKQFRRMGQESFYSLQIYYTEQETKYRLEIFPVKGQSSALVINPDEWGICDSESSVLSFDLTEDGFVFLAASDYSSRAEDEKSLPGSVCLVYTDEQGRLVSQTDLTAMLQDQGLFQVICENANDNELYRDREGYFYLVTDRNGRLLILNGEGSFVSQYRCAYDDFSRNKIEGPFKDESGRMIFPVQLYDEGCTKLFGRTGGELQELVRIEEPTRGKWYGMYGSSVYYVDIRNNLIRWNVTTGFREEIMELASLGIATSGIGDTYMLFKGEKDVWIRVCVSKEDYVLALSAQMPEYDDPTRLVIVADANDGVFLNSTLVEFNRKNPQYSVTLEMAEENSEMFRTRIMADIMAGGGPDILCVSPEDMEILAQAGALVDLEQLISGETLEMLLPGVLQMGRCGGRFMGVAPQVMTGTLITSDNTWTEDSWTLEDFLTLAEQKEGLEGLLTYGLLDMSEHNVLLNLVGRDLENSRFLDMENGISCFEQEDFMRVLEIIKQYTSNSASSYVDGNKRVAEGTYLAEYRHIFSPLEFYNMNAEIDGGGHVVGFPTASGSGSYIGDRGLLVVNAKSEKLESVTAFLEYLLSFENQSALELGSLSVRSDMADRLVVYFDALDSYVWQGKTGVILLESRADGTTYTEEYNDYLQSCVPVKNVSPIFKIVSDEAQSYFSGDKDALTVTRTIDNRVQLYLDERK